jgi:stage IV sporulation protein FB
MGFRLGKIPVKIHMSFFITAVVFSLAGRQNEPMLIVEWALVLLVSVMIHELGHALTGIAFGLAPRIDLHGMGGTTSWTQARGALTPAKSVLISVAGPLVGIVVGVLTFVLASSGALPASALAQQVAADMVWVNAGWGVVNLLPVLPMDGGNILFTVLNAATKGKGERPARVISIVAVVIGGLVALVFRMWWAAMLAAYFAYDNVRALRALAAAEHAAPTPIG